MFIFNLFCFYKEWFYNTDFFIVKKKRIQIILENVFFFHYVFETHLM